MIGLNQPAASMPGRISALSGQRVSFGLPPGYAVLIDGSGNVWIDAQGRALIVNVSIMGA